jgi:hypothetical protein
MPSRGKEQRGAGAEQVSPPRYPETTPPPRLPSSDYTYVLEIVMNMQNTMGKLTEAVENLKEGQKEQRTKLEQIGKQIYAAIVVIVLVGSILGFFANSINNLLFRLLQSPAQQQQQQQPTTPK